MNLNFLLRLLLVPSEKLPFSIFTAVGMNDNVILGGVIREDENDPVNPPGPGALVDSRDQRECVVGKPFPGTPLALWRVGPLG